MQGAAQPTGRTAQGASRVYRAAGSGVPVRAVRPVAVCSGPVRARAGLPVQAQGAEELGGLGAQVTREGVTARGHRRRPGGGRGVRRFKVLLCHAGASGRL